MTAREAHQRAAELEGRVVTLIGPMAENSGGGSQPPAALEGRVCSVLTLGPFVYLNRPPWRWDGKAPTPFWCCGDQTATCCGVKRALMIVARGVYRRDRSGDYYEPGLIEHALLCEVRPGTLRLVRDPRE
jgi:hypothetical protein